MSTNAAATAATDRAVEDRALRVRNPRLMNSLEREAPLGPKTAQLHARRQRLAASRPISGLAERHDRDDHTIASTDGALAYVLQAIPSGLHIERTQRRPFGAHLVQHMLFRSAESFVHWCENEPVRFDHPTVFGRLRRQGDELLRGTR